MQPLPSACHHGPWPMTGLATAVRQRHCNLCYGLLVTSCCLLPRLVQESTECVRTAVLRDCTQRILISQPPVCACAGHCRQLLLKSPKQCMPFCRGNLNTHSQTEAMASAAGNRANPAITLCRFRQPLSAGEAAAPAAVCDLQACVCWPTFTKV